MEPDLQFAVCRRCPKAYHRKCLPRTIAFGDNDDNSFQQRAWEGLLPKRILIYCTDHKIIPRIGTPKRDHILFPCVDREKQQASGLLKEKVILEKRSKVFGSLSESAILGRPVVSNRDKLQKLVDSRKGTTKFNVAGDNACHVKSLIDKKRDWGENSYITMKKSKTFKDSNLSVLGRVSNSSVMDKNKTTFRRVQSNSLLHINSHELKSKKQVLPSVKTEERFPAKPAMKTETHMQHLEDTEMQKRILKLMKDSTSSFNEEKFKKELRMRCSHETYVSRTSIDKTITIGKVEASVKAVQAALKKLDAGCSIEEAKVVCEPEILNQLIKWKKKLRVYLAPFLHGVRYTSFGRHFTKAEKLKEIVNRLHWYVKDGDMIVDFSCGANEFSCLMKEKLDEVGKSCSFKNYDLFTPPNDFGYEKRDWMSVGVEELPAGSRLIMGLNPPFGVEASLANQFIDKALTFKPKLLILIVPKETQRPDKKKPPYDIIWEDAHMLSGKAFYLPGSIDVHGEQLEDWNNNPPLLYLWSRPDWSAEHKTIAQKHGHLSQKKAEKFTFGVDRAVSNYLMEENHDYFGDFSNIMSGGQNISNILNDVNGNCINETGVTGIQAEETFEEIFIAPAISPVDCANSQRNVGASFTAPSEMHARNEGFQYTQTMSYSGHNPMSGSEYSRYAAATTVPHITRIGCPQISENGYPSATAVWPPGNSYIQSAYPSQPYIQPPTASYGQTFSSEPDQIWPPGTTPDARYYHQSFPSYLRPPGTEY